MTQKTDSVHLQSSLWDSPSDNTYFYSPSINITRDSNSHLNYIPTYNGKLVFDQIKNAVKIGIRSFTIVGAYGSGKSAFLWAFEKDLNGSSRSAPRRRGTTPDNKAAYFTEEPSQLLDKCNSFEFLDFVGDFTSVIDTFSQKLFTSVAVAKESNLIESIQFLAQDLKSKGKGLVIRIDEFGKFLEHAAKHNPEKELYFLQQLAELVNDTDQNIILLTTLHQDFSAYAYTLSKSQKSEWDKVKGRFKEITFNEPVEQLLFLAAERLKDNHFEFPLKQLEDLEQTFKKSQIFPLRDFFTMEVAQKILPLDLLSASILTLALQKYGQNERSLFSFIETDDHLGLKSFFGSSSQQPFPLFNLVSVYEYLNHHFYNYLHSKYNVDYAQWSAIRTSIERAEGVITKSLSTSIHLIKIIGLLNIFSKKSAKLNKEFLKEYAAITLNEKDTIDTIHELETYKIIRYVAHQDKYILFEGTDVDIELAIDQAGNLVEQINNVTKYLNEFFDLPYVPAKQYHYKVGTPRFFAFRITEEPINEIPKGEIDGFINLVFSQEIDSKNVQSHSQNCEEAILFAYFDNTSQIQNLVTEIEKVKKAKQDNQEDKIAVREFDNILAHQKKLLNHYVLDKLYSPSDGVIFYFKGEQVGISSNRAFNQYLSEICHKIYADTPIYLNEMVNKTKLSTPISLARKNLIKRLIENAQEADLGFSEKQYPPEKTIYLSLLKETGIHHEVSNDSYELGTPNDPSFAKLWEISSDFLEESKQAKRPLHEFVERLIKSPIKVKEGFIDFWLPIFLIIKKDDYALFGKEGYIPFLTADTLELIVKKPKDYEIKAFDVAGIRLEVFNKYRELISQSKTVQAGNQSFIETIKPFLSFYRSLPEYAKNTKSISKQAQRLRSAIAQSKEPEKAFFEEFPQALGYSLNEINEDNEKLEAYFHELRDAIKEIRTSYQQLLERFEAFILEEIIGRPLDFEAWKELLIKRFDKIKPYTLHPNQKVFFQRVNSPLDDKKAWLNAVAQAVLNESLEQIDDQKEYKLYDRFQELIHELDNHSEISQQEIDTEHENVVKLEITNLLEGVQKRLVRFPKSKNAKAESIENKLKSALSEDKNMNIFILTELLKEQLK